MRFKHSHVCSYCKVITSSPQIPSGVGYNFPISYLLPTAHVWIEDEHQCKTWIKTWEKLKGKVVYHEDGEKLHPKRKKKENLDLES